MPKTNLVTHKHMCVHIGSSVSTQTHIRIDICTNIDLHKHTQITHKVSIPCWPCWMFFSLTRWLMIEITHCWSTNSTHIGLTTCLLAIETPEASLISFKERGCLRHPIAGRYLTFQFFIPVNCRSTRTCKIC